VVLHAHRPANEGRRDVANAGDAPKLLVHHAELGGAAHAGDGQERGHFRQR
jgi:hypothetical protein